MSIEEIEVLLTRDLNSYQCKLNELIVRELVTGFQRWRHDTQKGVGLRDTLRKLYQHRAVSSNGERAMDPSQSTAFPLKLARIASKRQPASEPDPRCGDLGLTAELYEFLLSSLDREHQLFRRLEEWDAEFRKLFEQTAAESRYRLILDYAEKLGANRRQLRGDSLAFDRWFGYDTMIDRYRRRVGETERRIAFALERLGSLAAALLSATASPDAAKSLWKQLELDRVFNMFARHTGDFRVRVSAYRCLERGLESIERLGAHDTTSYPAGGTATAIVDDRSTTLTARTAIDATQNVWVQCAALSVLARVAPSTFASVVKLRLTQPKSGDDLFVRRHTARLIALSISTRPELAESLFEGLGDPSPFVRQAVASALFHIPSRALPGANALRRLALEDPVPCVRAAALVEGVAASARASGWDEFVGELLIEALRRETDPFVIRTALHVAATWTRQICNLKGSCRSAEPLSPEQLLPADTLELIRCSLLPELRRLQETAPLVAVRRWAARSAERIWAELDPDAQLLLRRFERTVALLGPTEQGRLPTALFRRNSPLLVGRVLAVLAQEDYGFEIERGWTGYCIRRSPRFVFRLWRLLHELLRPSPEKRQAFRHTIGRVSYAQIRVPSGILGELSETKVPGEPLFRTDEQGWRPYLPLVDDALSALNQWFWVRPVRLYSSEGVTTISPPRRWFQRFLAWLRLTLRFTHYARLRNWEKSHQTPPDAYVQSLEALGFGLDFQPYSMRDGTPVAADSSVTCFFRDRRAKRQRGTAVPVELALSEHLAGGTNGAHARDHEPEQVTTGAPGAFALGIASLNDAGEWLRQVVDEYSRYFTSVYGNSPVHLVAFATAVFALFFSRQLYLTWALRRARKQLALVVGGWGTRGKSGTERLKAALFNALGHSLVSKSTGCEAMFLHGPAYGDLRELIVYRPYDKATIWEQSNLMRFTRDLGATVFLWECMGLNPAYVNILQRQWSQDDLSTITNAYPDHEDIQGPAGINVAQTIAQFIPHKSKLLTTEEQMRPVLLDRAKQVGTAVRAVGWLESGLIPPDILQRFPYNEHPDNIALVLLLAQEIGCDTDFALKEMADRLVPDLGVLKTYPSATLKTRCLEFSNGMSANERLGTLGNWTRLGFDHHDRMKDRNVWITTVVNNRADRVARSRVFASVLVNDIRADRHFLIGGNLNGLIGYIHEAWEDFVAGVSLLSRKDDDPTDYALSVLAQMADRLRIPTEPSHLVTVVGAMLDGITVVSKDVAGSDLIVHWSDPERLARELRDRSFDELLIESLQAHQTQLLETLREYQDLTDRIRSKNGHDIGSIDHSFHSFLWKWFERKLIVIEDYYATGEQIVQTICSCTPPGFHNRIMGIQNIKGTGLDFVYRWQAWGKCYEGCRLLRSGDREEFGRGLRLLADFREFGLLSVEHVEESLALARQSPLAAREQVVTQLDKIQFNLNAALSRLRQELKGSRKRGRVAGLLSLAEQFVDATDAVRRRKTADQIYKDLTTERISVERAAQELQKLNKRQKGGWLAQSLAKSPADRDA